MRTALRIYALVLLVALFGSFPAFAFNDDWGGIEDDWSTLSNPTPGPSNPPTLSACTARRSQNQGCRVCTQYYNQAGQYMGYFTCAFVTWSAACGCEKALTPECRRTDTTCTYSDY